MSDELFLRICNGIKAAGITLATILFTAFFIYYPFLLWSPGESLWIFSVWILFLPCAFISGVGGYKISTAEWIEVIYGKQEEE